MAFVMLYTQTSFILSQMPCFVSSWSLKITQNDCRILYGLKVLEFSKPFCEYSTLRSFLFFFFWSQWILQQIPRWTVSWRENLGDDIAGAKAMSIFMAFAVFLQIVFERRWLQWGRECSTWASAVCWARKVLRAWYLLVQTLLLSFSFPECLRCSGQVA